MSFKTLYANAAGSIPGGITPIIVVFLFLLFIWYNIYRHTGIIENKLFRKGILIICSFMIVSFIIVRMMYPNPVIAEKILVMPFYDESQTKDDWFGEAIALQIEKQLNGYKDKDKLLFKYQWLRENDEIHLALDKKMLAAYVKQHAAITYLIFGTCSKNGTTYTFDISFKNVKTDSLLEIFTSTIEVSAYSDIVQLVVEKAERQFGLHKKKEEYDTRFSHSLSAMEQYVKGVNQSRSNNSKRALSFYEKAVTSDSTFVEPLVAISKYYLSERNLSSEEEYKEYALARAHNACLKAIKLSPENTDAYLQMAWIYLFQEKWLKTLDALKVVYHLNSREAELYYLLSKLHPQRYEYFSLKNKRDILEKALSINPLYLKAQFHLLDEYLTLRQNDVAAQLLRNILARDSTNVHALLSLSMVYLYKTEWDSVIATCQTLIALDTLVAEAHYNIGMAYNSQFKLDTAFTHFTVAAEMGYVNAYNYLALLHERKNEDYKAIEMFRKRLRDGERDEYWREIARKNLLRMVNKPGLDPEKIRVKR